MIRRIAALLFLVFLTSCASHSKPTDQSRSEPRTEAKPVTLRITFDVQACKFQMDNQEDETGKADLEFITPVALAENPQGRIKMLKFTKDHCDLEVDGGGITVIDVGVRGRKNVLRGKLTEVKPVKEEGVRRPVIRFEVIGSNLPSKEYFDFSQTMPADIEVPLR